MVIAHRVAISGGDVESVAMDACMGYVDKAAQTGKIVVGALVGGGYIVGALDAVVPHQSGERVVEVASDGESAWREGHDAPVGQGGANDKRVGLHLGKPQTSGQGVARRQVAYAEEWHRIARHGHGEGFEVATQRPRAVRLSSAGTMQAKQQGKRNFLNRFHRAKIRRTCVKMEVFRHNFLFIAKKNGFFA